MVGSQPRHALDVDALRAEGVDVILNLQQDKDLAYWRVDLHEISSRAAHHGMHVVRTPAVDFSPHSLRETLPRGEPAVRGPCAATCSFGAAGCAAAPLRLPRPPPACRPSHLPLHSAPHPAAAVRALEEARLAGHKVYCHCTAGLGRSPAVAIAALYWFTDMQLDEAYAFLTGIRPCGPSKDAIRGGEQGGRSAGRRRRAGWAALRRGLASAALSPSCA